MNLPKRILLLIGLVFLALPIIAANPSFSSFDTNQFSVANNRIRLLSAGSTAPVVYSNYYTFGTNYYISDTYVSNYFLTNILVDVSVSNYFNTNIYFSPTTNIYNSTIYAYSDNSTYVSNFFSTNLYTTNFFQQDSYVSNYFQTNFFITTNLSFTTNVFNITTNLIVEQIFQVTSNAYFLETNFVNYEIVTNLTVISNAYFTNITANRLTINETFVTNNYYANAYPFDTAWAGPTNSVVFTNGSLQSYTTLVPCHITNVTGVSIGAAGNTVLLCLTNAASTNVLVYPPSDWKVGWGETTPWTLTNADIIEIWFYESKNRRTVCTRGFH